MTANVLSSFALTLVGAVITWLGNGPMSRRKQPDAMTGLVVLGFLLRVAGPVLIAAGILAEVFLV